MTRTDVHLRTLAAGVLAATLAYAPGLQAQDAGHTPSRETTVTPLLTQPLAGIDGKEGSLVLVEYAPGAASPAHRHDADVFVYVLEGRVVMQVAGGEEVTLTAGETFHESPSDVHVVSRNASDTEPARILAFLVKEEDAPATVPVERP